MSMTLTLTAKIKQHLENKFDDKLILGADESGSTVTSIKSTEQVGDVALFVRSELKLLDKKFTINSNRMVTRMTLVGAEYKKWISIKQWLLFWRIANISENWFKQGLVARTKLTHYGQLKVIFNVPLASEFKGIIIDPRDNEVGLYLISN